MPSPNRFTATPVLCLLNVDPGLFVCLENGEPFVLRDVAGAEEVLWRLEADRCGYGSCVALPLLDGQRLSGVLFTAALEADAFRRDEVVLLMRLAATLEEIGLASLSEQRHPSCAAHSEPGLTP
jgi:hypothetical protein